MARFIAEIGSNHNRDLSRTESLIDACAASGATSAKVQIFQIEDLFAQEILLLKPELRARRDWEFPLDMLHSTAEYARSAGLGFGATPFGLWAVDELAPVVDFFKIASYEILWHDIIRACGTTGLPLIISTGMASLDEVDAVVDVARKSGADDLTLLHCVSGYPVPADQCNLAAIETLRERYDCPVGWSDHSAEPAVVERAARRWGASDIEVHVDLDGSGNEAGEHNWTPHALAETIDACSIDGEDQASHLPVDGDGAKRPMPVELPDVEWRADPSDGLRPLMQTRKALTD
jgi:N-acetylneuraminate synthase